MKQFSSVVQKLYFHSFLQSSNLRQTFGLEIWENCKHYGFYAHIKSVKSFFEEHSLFTFLTFISLLTK